MLYILTNQKRILLSFKDICKNGYHIETMNEDNVKYLYITSIIFGQKLIMEKLRTFSSRLNHTTIKPIESCCREPEVQRPKSFYPLA